MDAIKAYLYELDTDLNTVLLPIRGNSSSGNPHFKEGKSSKSVILSERSESKNLHISDTVEQEFSA